MRDYYQILGIPRHASQEKIKEAYRALARKLHPDINKAPDAQKQFSEVQEAYEVLSEPEKRTLYDRIGHRAFTSGGAGAAGGGRGGQAGGYAGGPVGGPGGFGFDADDISSVFDAFFGGGARAGGPSGAGPRRARPQHRPEPTRIDLPISFMTAIKGGRETIRVTRNGESRPVEITVPAGVTEGAKLRARIPGDGGEAVFVVKIGKHPIYRRVENKPSDLELDLPLTVAEATLGARVRVPTPDGAVGVTVPPGSSGGQRLRLRGHGIKPSDGPAGDLFARLRIATPDPKQLTNDEKDILRELDAKTQSVRTGDGWPEQRPSPTTKTEPKSEDTPEDAESPKS